MAVSYTINKNTDKKVNGICNDLIIFRDKKTSDVLTSVARLPFQGPGVKCKILLTDNLVFIGIFLYAGFTKMNFK